MPKDRTGEDLEEDPPHTCRNGWLTAPDADRAQLCPLCRDKSLRARRPVREWFEPVPSELAAAAIERVEMAEAEQARASRGHNVGLCD